MKKLTFWVVLPVFFAFIAGCGWIFFITTSLPQVDFLADPGVSFEVKFPDWQGSYNPFTVGPENPDWISLQNISQDLQNAVLSGEDFSFYSHSGIDWFELKESLVKDLRERRFARGASTITQQLAKNLFLSREKTVKRKVREVILAMRMEKALTKERILELYLNVVELGDGVYGVGAGARHHFNKQPSQLSLRECAFLAAMLPGPRLYDPGKRMDRVMNRSDHLLGVMLKGRMITDDQYLAALVEIPLSVRSSDPVSEKPELQADPLEETLSGENTTYTAYSHYNGETFDDPDDGIVEIPLPDRDQGTEERPDEP